MRYREALKGWSKITTHLHIWDYINNFIDYLRPVPMMHILEPAVRSYREHGVTGVMYQSNYQSLGGVRSPLKAWVIAKLLWDPSRDVAALMADFTWGYYGKAAPAMVAFDTLLEEDRQEDRPFFTDKRAFALIEEAERRAEDDDVLHRVKVAKLPLLKASLDRAVGQRKPGSGEPELGEYFEQGAGDRQVAVYHEWIDEFEQTAQAVGLGTWSEQAQPPPHRRVDGLILFWRELLSAFQSEVSGAEISGTWRFRVDPGSGLKRKGENLLAVRVYNRLAMGGIWKPVYLFSTEEEASLHWMLDVLDGKLRAREK